MQGDGFEHLAQALIMGGAAAVAQRLGDAFVGFQGQLQVLKYRELLKDGGLLELAADAELRNLGLGVAQQVYGAAEKDAARIGPGLAGDDVHHGGFARAVGPDDAAQLARRDVQRQAIDGFEAVKADAHVFQVQDAAVRQVQRLFADAAAKTRLASTRCGLQSLAHLALLQRGQPLCALVHQLGRHGCCPRRRRTSPITPCGNNKVTTMNRAPRKYNQNSG